VLGCQSNYYSSVVLMCVSYMFNDVLFSYEVCDIDHFEWGRVRTSFAGLSRL